MEHNTKEQAMNKRLIKLDKAAELLDMNGRTLRQYCLTKRVAGLKIGECWYLEPKEIDNIIKRAKEGRF